MKRGNSGQIRVIEAFLAVFIVFSAFTVTTNFAFSPNDSKRIDLTSIGLQTLMSLDSDGTLAKTISQGNWTALGNALDLALPNSVTFNATILDENMTQVNTEPITNGAFASQETSVVEYVYASSSPIFKSYTIQLRLGVAE